MTYKPTKQELDDLGMKKVFNLFFSLNISEEVDIGYDNDGWRIKFDFPDGYMDYEIFPQSKQDIEAIIRSFHKSTSIERHIWHIFRS